MAETEKARIGGFELVEKIGEGSLGTVFKAVCLADLPPSLVKGQVVALKKLHPSADRVREIEALKLLTHPHIVRFFTGFVARQGEWDEAACLVTEFLDGCDLAGRLKSAPAGLPWEEAQRILLDTLDALAFAESRGVVHRDLKPSNLFLCRDGAVKVIDFGLARRTGGAKSVAAGNRTVGGLTGTLDYMAPEFARADGFRGDVRSDLFSFGCLAFQAVTGALPFPALNDHPEIGFIRRWTAGQPPRVLLPRPLAYGWDGLAPFLARCLNPDRDARFGSFREAREALAAIRPRVLAGAEESYTLTAFLASGGFCDVFRARGDKSGNEVAVKRLHAGRHEWRFRREAGLLQSLRELNHPAIVRVHELLEEEGPDGRPCLIMEYLPGDDLRRRLTRAQEEGAVLPLTETVRLFIRYLDGLEALHRRGIVHRDIKPANLYAPAGRPEQAKLLDLGIACEQDGTVSMHGMPPGTLDYMAPELAVTPGARGSPQSDLFALGCSLYETLAGRPPLKRLPAEDAAAIRALCARSESDLAFQAAFEGFDYPAFREQPELAVIVGCAMRYHPPDRYGGREETDSAAWSGAGARAMKDALLGVLNGAGNGALEPQPTVAPEAPAGDTAENTVDLEPAPSPGRGKRIGLIGALLIVSIIGTSWALLHFRGRPAASAEPLPGPAPAIPAFPEPIKPEPAPVVPEEPTAAVTSEAPVAATIPAPVEPVKPEPPRTVIRPAPKKPEPAVAAVPAPAVKPAPALVAAAPTPAAREHGTRAQLIPLLDEAESAIAGCRGWLYRIADPLRSVTLRRYEPNRKPPAWDVALPFLLNAEQDALEPGMRWRYERARLWEGVAPRLDQPADAKKLADALTELAGRADAGLAEQCRFESRLLEWNGAGLPDIKALPAIPEIRLWRAHALGATGDDQDARDVLKELGGYAGATGAVVQAEDALLAVRAADQCLGQMARDIRDKTSPDTVTPGTGQAVRDPLAAYTQAVIRVKEQAAEDVRLLVAVARATGPEAAGALAGRVRTEAAQAGVGDWTFALSELDATPWRAARQAWPDRKRLTAGDRAILDQMLGRAPLPKKIAEIPAPRLRAAGGPGG